MQSIVTQFIERNQLLTPGATVLIAVSGGPDSMALLHYYRSIRESWNLNLLAVSVDHQLRGDQSKQDVAYVKAMCERWQVEFIEASADVHAYKKEKKVGTQVAARYMRYQVFAKQMNIHQADYLALGHHADDQIETMLMGFVRGASPNALSGIPVTRKFCTGKIVRPFLCVTKSDIKAYCVLHEIMPRIDPSNEDDRYTRNYFREHIIPLIKERNKQLPITIQRLSKSLQEDEQLLQEYATERFKQIIHFKKNHKEASFNIKQFKSNPQALQRRIYHLILDYLYNQLPENLSYAHEDAFFALLEEGRGNVTIDFPNDLKIERSYEKLALSFKEINSPKFIQQETLQIPSVVELPNQAKLILSYTDHVPEQHKYIWVCSTENIELPLFVRTRKPGDRMSWQGLNGTKKIKDIFIDEKIPRKRRESWPIVVDKNDEILWLIGLRKRKQSFNTKGKPLYIVLKYEKGHI